MATPNTRSLDRSPTAAGPIEQLVVTHCLKEDSVLGQEGFSVRAASPGARDPAMMEWALKLDYYELPLDMKTGALLVNQAPRRLARVPGPGGRVALVHTAYLPQDTVGRSHSFISQILLLEELSTLSAAAAWGSSDWHTSEFTRGETKVLQALDRLPRGTLIDDTALKGFLSSAPAPADQSLARTIYPGRVESNPEARRRWVRAALVGFLKAVEPNSRRARMCILAEPGSVALLVYAISRLLPQQIAGSFSFSTYEPPHTTLRENKVARLIGSFARNGLDRVDLESLRRRGYVLDTFRNEEDHDLSVGADWPLEGLLKLAAEGDWRGVDEIRELWSRDPRIAPGVSSAALADALRVRPLAAALKNGTLGADGLLELRHNRLGEELLRDNESRRPTWEVVRKVWTQPRIRHEFVELLRAHVDELLDDLSGLVESGSTGAWREAWSALKPVIPDERRVDDFSRLLAAMERTGAALPASERSNLVGEWCQTAPETAVFPAGLYWLLHAGSADAFRVLVGSSSVTARVAGLASCLALSSPADWAAEPAFLKDLQEDHFHAFIADLPIFDSRKAVYDRLRSARGLSKALVDRLIRLRGRLPESRVEEVLSAIGCDDPVWHDYWIKGEGANFAALLERVGSDSALARRIWSGLIARVTAKNFVDAQESGLGVLVDMRARYPNSLSREQQERLDAWNAVNLEFASPPKTQPADKASNLAAACGAIDVPREDLAQSWFRTHVSTAASPAELKDKAEKFGRTLIGFFETEEAACERALELSAGLEARELRRRCMTALFDAIVSDENRDRLASRFENELLASGIRPEPVVDLLQRRKRGGGQKRPGFGLFRLSPQATRSVLLFASGAFFAALLMVVLLPLFWNGVAAWWSSNKPDETELALGAARKEGKRLKDELESSQEVAARVRKQLEDREAWNQVLEDQLEAAGQRAVKPVDPSFVGPPESTDRAPAKQDSVRAPDGGTRDPLPWQTVMMGDLVRVALIERPLANDRDFARTLELTKELEERRLVGEQFVSLPYARRLLKGLSYSDAPNDVGPKPSKPDNEHTEFAFLSGDNGQSVLATIRHGAVLGLYFFEVKDGRVNWTAKVSALPGRDPTVLVASPLGQCFIAAQKADDHTEQAYLYVSSRVYELVNSKVRPKRQPYTTEEQTAINLKPGTWARLAITDSQLYAFATPPGALQWPQVVIASKVGKETPADLGAFGDNFGAEPVSGLTFDPTGHVLVVGLRKSKRLPVFELINDHDKAGPVTLPVYPHAVRGWAHCSRGNLAVITDEQVFVDELIQLNRDGVFESVKRGTRTLLPEKFSPSVRLTSVAFSPKGTILATGDEDGVIAIRQLDRPIAGREVLRLAHVGPIQKIAFSPDGRVLAALASRTEGKDDGLKEITAEEKSKVRPGVIRLWVTQDWEHVEDPSSVPAPPKH